MARGNMNDLMYNELLTSPNHDLIFAIGTTYSLSMEAMLMVPISFGLLGELDDNIKHSPIALLEAIRRSADKFVIFCNKGSIAVPNDIRNVYSLLENSIVEVSDKKNHLANFHPKLWIVKERDRENGDLKLKVIVLSRNLTFDNSIDIACAMTGKIGKEKSLMSEKHAPLKEMLRKLNTYATDSKKKEINKIIQDIDRVEKFDIDGDIFEKEGYDFFPLWYGKSLNNQYDIEKELNNNASIVVSPFIDTNTIKHIKPEYEGRYRNVLITRKNYIDEAVFNLYDGNGDIYAVSDTMLDNMVACIDLHAKMYWVFDNNNGRYLYLGSANATGSGFNRNTEFLLRLKYKKGKNYTYEDFLNNFVNEDDKRFEKIDSPYVKEVKSGYTETDKIFKEFINLRISASVDVNDNLATIKINISDYNERFSNITISPLQLKNISKKAAQSICFDNVSIEKLSELYIITLECGDEKKTAVLKIKTDGIPAERNDLILRSIVNTPQKFIDYISFMVAEQPNEMISQMLEHERENSICERYTIRHDEPKVYEQLLKMAYNNPQQLKEIGEVMNKLSSDVTTPQFKQMYDKFMSIMKTLERL